MQVIRGQLGFLWEIRQLISQCENFLFIPLGGGVHCVFAKRCK